MNITSLEEGVSAENCADAMERGMELLGSQQIGESMSEALARSNRVSSLNKVGLELSKTADPETCANCIGKVICGFKNDSPGQAITTTHNRIVRIANGDPNRAKILRANLQKSANPPIPVAPHSMVSAAAEAIDRGAKLYDLDLDQVDPEAIASQRDGVMTPPLSETEQIPAA